MREHIMSRHHGFSESPAFGAMVGCVVWFYVLMFGFIVSMSLDVLGIYTSDGSPFWASGLPLLGGQGLWGGMLALWVAGLPFAMIVPAYRIRRRQRAA